MSRHASVGQLAALEHSGEKERAAPQKPMTRTPSAPAQLDAMQRQDLGEMTAAARADLADAAYFSPAPPSPPAADGPLSLNPNALSLHPPHLGGLPLTSADIDRGQINLTEQHGTPAGRLTLNEARNIGGSVVGGTLEMAQSGWPGEAKLGASAVVNGQTLGLAPALGLRDAAQNEFNLGTAAFGAIHDEVRILPDNGDGDHVAIEARTAFTRGFAVDPRTAIGPFGVGAFGKVLRSETNEQLYRHAVSGRRAGTLLTRQQDEGVTASVKNRVRQWTHGMRDKPQVRQPDVLDPMGENGGRPLRPGQEVVRFCSRTGMFGGGIGFFGVRGGRYSMSTEDLQLTVRCLDDAFFCVTINPRDVQSTSDSVDTLLGPGWQRVSSVAQATRWQRIFDLRDPAQQVAYTQLIRQVTGTTESVAEVHNGETIERSRLEAHDQVQGFVRLPGKTSWGGWGTHASQRDLHTERDQGGLENKKHEMMTQITQHALHHGKTSRVTQTVAEASRLVGAQAACMLAFRGLTVQTTNTGSRSDATQRNAMLEEHERLFRQAFPRVKEAPRTDFIMSVTAMFSGRQLHGLGHDLPQRAANIAKSVGATAEGLPALIAQIRQVGAPDKNHDAMTLAWQRGALVSDYLRREGAPGFAALHRLMGGVLRVETHTTTYETPLQELRTLQKTRRITPARARKLKAQLETALLALHADVILRSNRQQQWKALQVRLQEGLATVNAAL